MAFSEGAHGDVQVGDRAWQARALQRSLGDAQARSVERMDRLVDAARDLANETGNAAFTVSQVAERTGLSLKTFYRCFSGKDDLLLALLEEESRLGAAILADQLVRHDEPVARLRAYVDGIFDLLTHPGAAGYAGVLVREHRRLGEDHPAELRAALSPLVDLLRDQIEPLSGDAARAAETLFGLVLSGIGDVSLGRADPRDEADWLWRFCWNGLRGDAR